MLSLPPFFCLPECNNSWGDLDALRGQHGSCRRPWQVFFCMFSLNYVHLLMHRVFRRKATCTDYLARPSFLLPALPSVHQFSEVTYWIVPYYKSCVKSWDVTVPNYIRSFRGLQRHSTEMYLTKSPVTRVESSSYFTVPDSIPCVKGWEVTIRNYTWLYTLWPWLREHRNELSVPSISPVSMVERAPYWTVPYYIPCDRAWEVIVLDCIWLYSRVKGWEVTVMKCTWLYPLCPGLKGHRTSSCWKDKPQNYWLSEERKIWMIV